MGDIEFIHDICKFCGWENDDVKDNEPDYFGGANRMSLNQYKQFWQEKSQEILKATNTCFTAIELAREYYNEHFKEQNEEALKLK